MNYYIQCYFIIDLSTDTTVIWKYEISVALHKRCSVASLFTNIPLKFFTHETITKYLDILRNYLPSIHHFSALNHI